MKDHLKFPVTDTHIHTHYIHKHTYIHKHIFINVYVRLIHMHTDTFTSGLFDKLYARILGSFTFVCCVLNFCSIFGKGKYFDFFLLYRTCQVKYY